MSDVENVSQYECHCGIHEIIVIQVHVLEVQVVVAYFAIKY